MQDLRGRKPCPIKRASSRSAGEHRWSPCSALNTPGTVGTRRQSTVGKVLVLGLLLLPVAAGEVDAVEPDASERFTATLTGANEIPARTTRATGTALFELNRAGTELRYTLTINNISGL